MAYSTIDDIRAHLPEEEMLRLTDDEGLGEVIDSRVIGEISRADAFIDSYCGVRYKVPVSAAPDILNKLSVDIAVYGLYSRMIAEVPVARAERHRNAIGHLEDIARGKISLGIKGVTSESDIDKGAESNKEIDGNVFSRRTMEGY